MRFSDTLAREMDVPRIGKRLAIVLFPFVILGVLTAQAWVPIMEKLLLQGESSSVENVTYCCYAGTLCPEEDLDCYYDSAHQGACRKCDQNSSELGSGYCCQPGVSCNQAGDANACETSGGLFYNETDWGSCQECASETEPECTADDECGECEYCDPDPEFGGTCQPFSNRGQDCPSECVPSTNSCTSKLDCCGQACIQIMQCRTNPDDPIDCSAMDDECVDDLSCCGALTCQTDADGFKSCQPPDGISCLGDGESCDLNPSGCCSDNCQAVQSYCKKDGDGGDPGNPPPNSSSYRVLEPLSSSSSRKGNSSSLFVLDPLSSSSSSNKSGSSSSRSSSFSSSSRRSSSSSRLGSSSSSTSRSSTSSSSKSGSSSSSFSKASSSLSSSSKPKSSSSSFSKASSSLSSSSKPKSSSSSFSKASSSSFSSFSSKSSSSSSACLNALVSRLVTDRFALACNQPDGGQLCQQDYSASFTLTEKSFISASFKAAEASDGISFNGVPAGHCSAVRLHVTLDGKNIGITSFLGWNDGHSIDPEGRSLLAQLLSNRELPAGTHTIALKAEGTPGGCNTGNLVRWGGTLKIDASVCPSSSSSSKSGFPSSASSRSGFSSSSTSRSSTSSSSKSGSSNSSSSQSSSSSSAGNACLGIECMLGGNQACAPQQCILDDSTLNCFVCRGSSSSISSRSSNGFSSSQSSRSSIGTSSSQSSKGLSSSQGFHSSSSFQGSSGSSNSQSSNRSTGSSASGFKGAFTNSISCISTLQCPSGHACISGICLRPDQTIAGLIPPFCGNRLMNPGEECDDGNNRDYDGCSASCFLENGTCGDGVVQKLLGEQCEPLTHDRSLPYRCGPDCRHYSDFCGNGSIDAGEECDDGTRNDDRLADHCRVNCSKPRCGDSILDSAEQCDDGNRRDGDGCDRYCGNINNAAGSAPGFTNDVFPGDITTRPPAGKTGPEVLVFMAAGAASGIAWMRRKKRS